jgi:hypothetical protein
VTTTARTSRSPARSAIACTQDEVISADIALRWSGWSRVSSTTPSLGRVTLRWLSDMAGAYDEGFARPECGARVNHARFTLSGAPFAPGPPRAVGSSRPDGKSHSVPAGFPCHPRRGDRELTSKEAVMAETWSGEFYCVKCKEKREAEGEVRVNDKGTRMAKAVCPVCGTNLNRILGKA